jgi:hypothetical protein
LKKLENYKANYSTKQEKKNLLLHTIIVKLLGDLERYVHCIAAHHCCKTFRQSETSQVIALQVIMHVRYIATHHHYKALKQSSVLHP